MAARLTFTTFSNNVFKRSQSSILRSSFPISRCFTTSKMLMQSIPPHYSPTTPPPKIKGMLTIKNLEREVAEGNINTVVMGFTDMYGRLMGKRFDAEFFLSNARTNGTHACDYLLACNMDMDPIPGFKFSNWEHGYGDFHLVADISTLRWAAWAQKTAIVICDVKDDKTHQFVSVAPRSVLRHQIDNAAKSNYEVLAASELEYYIYKDSYRDAKRLEYSQSKLTPISDYVEDYHLLQTAREEQYSSHFRQALKDSGVPVENTKGEAGIGQGELNIIYSDILQMSDRHAIYKQCLKEMANDMGVSLTFMAKPFSTSTGSGCHLHLNLSREGRNAFMGETKFGPVSGSDIFKYFLGGWLKYTPDVMVFYAPTINSYKRYQTASWAPTRIAWSYDNRTAGFRVVGSGKSLRIECRIPGADCNPYLAFAASLASGLEGIKNKIEPPPIFEGDIYAAKSLPTVPKTLHEAIKLFEKSEFANQAFGRDVVEHYAHFYRSEQESFDKYVTDWERIKYFERI